MNIFHGTIPESQEILIVDFENEELQVELRPADGVGAAVRFDSILDAIDHAQPSAKIHERLGFSIYILNIIQDRMKKIEKPKQKGGKFAPAPPSPRDGLRTITSNNFHLLPKGLPEESRKRIKAEVKAREGIE